MKTDPAMLETFYKKWRYVFAYASAGFASGYLTSHMFTFIRTVCVLWTLWPCFKLTDAYCRHRMINHPSDDYWPCMLAPKGT
jgi:hypothetical protein